MPYLATAFLILLLLPASAFAQAGVSYQIPPDNPFAGQAGAAPEVYAYGLRNPYRYSFDRQTGDLLIGDVGGSQREEIDWIGAAAARGANFGWACREGKVAGPRSDECPVPDAVEPLFDYPTSSPDAVTGGFVVRDPSLTGLFGRYLYADYYTGLIRSLALDFANPDDQSTGLTVGTLGSFGEDASRTALRREQRRRAGRPAGRGRYPGDARLPSSSRGRSPRRSPSGPIRATRRGCSWHSRAGW